MAQSKKPIVSNPRILKLKSSKDLIYDFVIGNAMAAYEHNFASDPDTCKCGHKFMFQDRLAAAILMGAHDKDEIWDFFKTGPRVKEYFEGALYCGECQNFVIATLNYEYPNHKTIPHDDFEKEYIKKFSKALSK